MVCRCGRREPQDALHVGQEPEVEHLVCLVQHQRAGLGQVQVLLPGQVEQAARGADHDVDGGQRLDLRLVGAAAVQRDDVDAAAGSGQSQVVGDLDGKFPGGDHDQGARRGGRAAGRLVQPLDQRDAERQGLARPGPGLADDVLPAQRYRQRQFLDREGGDDPGGFERVADRAGHPELAEGLVGNRGSRGPQFGDRVVGPGVRHHGPVSRPLCMVSCSQGFQPPSVARGSRRRASSRKAPFVAG